jgi:hypothetical protein
MGLPGGLSSCPQGQDNLRVAGRNVLAFISAEDWLSGSPDLKPLDYKLWVVLEDMACWNRHNNLDSLKRSLVKLGQRVAILSDIIINKNLKLLLINYMAQKVDVLFHFPSRSQNHCNRTYGKIM